MANLSSTDDPYATQPIDPRLPQPATHGQVKIGRHHQMTEQDMRNHLTQHVEHTNVTKDYGGHGIGSSSYGAFSTGGAAGADYQTTSTGGTSDTGLTQY